MELRDEIAGDGAKYWCPNLLAKDCIVDQRSVKRERETIEERIRSRNGDTGGIR